MSSRDEAAEVAYDRLMETGTVQVAQIRQAAAEQALDAAHQAGYIHYADECPLRAFVDAVLPALDELQRRTDAYEVPDAVVAPDSPWGQLLAARDLLDQHDDKETE